ncbi:mitogen-activated protein kinase, partial [Aduncisulcus paluster]
MYQLLCAIHAIHHGGIFHRDVKPENILITGDQLRLADFGSCRGVFSKPPFTEYISTRWYRAPECLLTDGWYNHKMDLWAVGCVFFEIMALYPLFPGTHEVDQVRKIHDVLGTPPQDLLMRMKRHSHSQHIDFNFPHKQGCGIPKLLPHATSDCLDLLTKLLTYNPDMRISAKQALAHPYFSDVRAVLHTPRGIVSEPAPHSSERTGSSSSSITTRTSPRMPSLISKKGGSKKKDEKKKDRHSTTILPSTHSTSPTIKHGSKKTIFGHSHALPSLSSTSTKTKKSGVASGGFVALPALGSM